MRPGEPCILSQDNPARETLDLIADKWSILIIFALRDGELRFAQLHRMIEGITQKMLIQTLRHMERDGLIERRVYPVVPPKVEYKLSELGRSLSPLLILISDWSDAHLKEVYASRQAYDARESAGE